MFIFASITVFVCPTQILDWLVILLFTFKLSRIIHQKRHFTFMSSQGLFKHIGIMFPTMKTNIVLRSKGLCTLIIVTLLAYRIIMVFIFYKLSLYYSLGIGKILQSLHFCFYTVLMMVLFVLCIELIEVIYVYNISLPYANLDISLGDKSANEIRFLGFQILRSFEREGNNEKKLGEYLKYELVTLNKLIQVIETKLKLARDGTFKYRINKAADSVKYEMEEYVYSVGLLLNIWKVIKKRRAKVGSIIDCDNLMMLRFLKDKCHVIEKMYDLGINTQIFGDLEILRKYL